MHKILEFKGNYRFLSNFYQCRFVWNTVLWHSSEAAYQASKSNNFQDWLYIRTLNPGEAKRYGKHITLRPDWEQVKYSMMWNIVREKFKQNPDLLKWPKATGTSELEEGNNWGDRIWGICPPGSHNGDNYLGKILMQVRNEL